MGWMTCRKSEFYVAEILLSVILSSNQLTNHIFICEHDFMLNRIFSEKLGNVISYTTFFHTGKLNQLYITSRNNSVSSADLFLPAQYKFTDPS